MEQMRVLCRLILTVTCLVCLAVSGGMCSEFDPLIKTYVSSSISLPSNENLVYSGKLKDEVRGITESEWDSLVIQSKLPVMVMFTAPDCIRCRKMDTILNRFDSDYKNKFKFYTINFFEESTISDIYVIVTLPSFLVFKGGDLKDEVMEPDTEKLLELIKQYM